MNTIAIIPAKACSTRCPGKNLRQFVGLPLFMHSVLYAQHEGIEPIVSTDSDEVVAVCTQRGVRVVREVVDESNMANCVRQVLAQVPCEAFVLLQPTSPLRCPGMLRRMLQALRENKCESAFTASPIKPIGLLDGKFCCAGRDQDTKERFWHFDGNIVAVSRAYFERNGELFDDRSLPFENTFPCMLQIDTEEEFAALHHLAMHGDFRKYLPPFVRRVCVVSNRPYFLRDYSAFVDGCDIVIRISKMENLDSGLSGSKTDVAVVACWAGYLAYSRAARHVDALKNVPTIFFDPESVELTRLFCEQEGIDHWAFIPEAENKESWHFSTFGKAVLLADRLFPEAKLYCLADLDVALRTSNSIKHTYSKEQPYVEALLQKGRLINILEDELPEDQCCFSLEIAPEKASMLIRMRLRQASHTIEHECVEVRHPQWKDMLRMADGVACRARRNDCAEVIERANDHFILKWDNWGVEKFVRHSDGFFVLAK